MRIDGPLARFAPGTPVQVRFRKFDGTPHWRNDSVLLGSDAFGAWIGAGPGTVFTRPGVSVLCPTWWTCLLSPRGFALTRYAEPSRGIDDIEIYIDLTTVPVWSAVDTDRLLMEAVDLDLDVVRRFGQADPWLDDAEEFAEHQVAMGYPPDLIAATERTAAEVLAEVTARLEPFAAVSSAWVARCQEIVAR